jgi:hypothetical protein
MKRILSNIVGFLVRFIESMIANLIANWLLALIGAAIVILGPYLPGAENAAQATVTIASELLARMAR